MFVFSMNRGPVAAVAAGLVDMVPPACDSLVCHALTTTKTHLATHMGDEKHLRLAAGRFLLKVVKVQHPAADNNKQTHETWGYINKNPNETQRVFPKTRCRTHINKKKKMSSTALLVLLA